MPMLVTKNVFTVGFRYGHHASHSGYELFAHHLKLSNIKPPFVNGRFLRTRLGRLPYIGDIGKALDDLFAMFTGKRLYTFSILLLEIWTIIHMLLNRRKSLYHVLYGETDIRFLPAASKILGHKLIATFHEPVETLPWFEMDEIIAQLDGVILVNRCQKVYFQRLLPNSRLYFVPHAVDAKYFRPRCRLRTSNAYSRKLNAPLILTVGSHLRDFKTYGRCASLLSEKGYVFDFIAVGAQHSDGSALPLSSPLVSYVHGISDDDLLTLYRKACVFVLPLRSVTANNALLEAMACGVPIVATGVDGIFEYVTPRGAEIVPPSNPGAMADAILKVIYEYGRNGIMRKANRAHALRYSKERVARKMARLYSRLLSVRLD
jgi:glycosyltransferase involved in cell wall biosynthesis